MGTTDPLYSDDFYDFDEGRREAVALQGWSMDDPD